MDKLESQVQYFDTTAGHLAAIYLMLQAIFYSTVDPRSDALQGNWWISTSLSASISIVFWMTFVSAIRNCLRIRRQQDLIFMEHETLYQTMSQLSEEPLATLFKKGLILEASLAMDSSQLEDLNLNCKESSSLMDKLESQVQYFDTTAGHLAAIYLMLQAIFYSTVDPRSVALHGNWWISLCLSASISIVFWMTFVSAIRNCMRIRRQQDLIFMEQERLYQTMSQLSEEPLAKLFKKGLILEVNLAMDSSQLEDLNLNCKELSSLMDKLESQVQYSNTTAGHLAAIYIMLLGILYSTVDPRSVALQGNWWISLCLPAFISIVFWVMFVSGIRNCLRIRRQKDLAFMEQERLYRTMYQMSEETLEKPFEKVRNQQMSEGTLAKPFEKVRNRRYVFVGALFSSMFSVSLLVMYVLIITMPRNR